MALRLLQFKPGIVKDVTQYTAGKNGPFYVDGDKVRFQDGFPTKIGGWEKETQYGLSPNGDANYTVTATAIGVPRNMVSWRAITDGEDYLAIGTHNHLMINENQALFDITPIRATSTSLSNPFATTSGSSVVTVTDTAHGALDGDWVRFEGATATNGIAADTINAAYGYQLTYIDANSYTVDFGTNATSTGSGGGTGVDANYLIGAAAGLGTQTSNAALGWGSGGWGLETWGTPRTISTSLRLENSQWSINNWGEDIIANVRNGAIYYWDTSAGVGTRAVLVSGLGGASDVPAENRLTTVSFPDRHLVSMGCTPLGGTDIDPMLVRWSNQEDYAYWTPTATNTAGDQRLVVGTKITSAISTRDETFISTDEAVYGMNFVGPPFTFAFRLLATNCGAIGKNVMGNVDGDVYWMTNETFFVYNGAVREIPCPVKHYVFDRMQKNYSDKFFCALNKDFDEVTWFYVSTDVPATTPDPEPDSYVTYNYRDNAWSIGTMDRTVWLDAFGFRKVPFAYDEDGYLYNHETGADADGAAMTAFIETSPMEVSQTGDDLMLVDKIVPDANMAGTLNLTVKSRKYPNDTDVTKGPFTISPNSTKVSLRARGRQIGFKLESSALGDEWLIGDFRVNARQDGLR
jgi:hypothetical protein